MEAEEPPVNRLRVQKNCEFKKSPKKGMELRCLFVFKIELYWINGEDWTILKYPIHSRTSTNPVWLSWAGAHHFKIVIS